MPARRRSLTTARAADVVAECFHPCSEPLCGLELEWPTHLRADVAARPDPACLLAAAGSLPRGSRVTVEPGGQVELSTLPAPTADTALDAATEDAAVLHHRLAGAGFDAAERAVDTCRAPQRVLDAPRYACMESFFAAGGDAGSWMMGNTASLQVNVGHDPLDPYRRWALAHRIGPVLVAAFANSPGLDAAGRRWESLRQGIWWSVDPGRTRPPRGPWLDYVLDADVMLIRSRHGAVAVPPGLAFGRWMTGGHPMGWPTAEDLRYHLSTLFPPVRPRGWLELRMLDLLPPGLRDVAMLVVMAALTTDAARELGVRMPATDGLWCAAARHGLARPELAAAARILFDAVVPAVDAVTADQRRRDEVRAFAERGVSPSQLVADADLHARFAPTLLSRTGRVARGSAGACAGAGASGPAPAR